jgi:apolipoprotein N-acyltransferase
VLVAGITNSQTFTGTLPDPKDPAVISNTQTLIERTRKAATQGAAIAVWGEASTIVSEKGEEPLLNSLSELAKKHHIVIVAAYAVLLPKDEQSAMYHMKNKFTWIRADGSIAETYLKHHPVPGEGSVPGRAPLKVISTEYGKMAGDICYDDDFPEMSLTYARLGADLIVIPGLDWRGMLRRHTLMARIHAIEGGFSLLRSANDATSMGFDNLGQIRAAMTAFGDNDHILLASLPVERTDTLYSRIGNILAYIAIFALLILFFIAGRNHLLTKESK